MKNTILILISVLMVVVGALAIISSSGDYAAEKLFYRARKTYKKIAENPDVAPPKMLASVEADLRKIVERYPESKPAKAAHITLAEFYLMNKKYDQGLLTLNVIIDKYEEDASMASRARFLKGVAYERQDLWEKALKEYTIVRDKYTDTRLGLQVPFYIGYYYTQKGRLAEADKAYNEAVLFYTKLESENKGKVLGYAAANFLLQTYASLKQYEQAGEIVEYIIDNYSSVVTFTQQLANVDLIFIKLLNKSEKAIELYKRMKTKTTDSKLTNILNKKIKALEAQR